ncbi:MAG: fatty acid desaturase [Akkermansiaceae bacterium]|nr:fatty acid desaturase [Verrucomicrobiae bacterium]MCP5553946.1 fatty acid desaturase [Akkermansiaceae bacterium]
MFDLLNFFVHAFKQRDFQKPTFLPSVVTSSESVQIPANRRDAIAKWKAVIAEYQKPVLWRAIWQLVNTIGGYAVVWYLIYLSLSVSWWLTLPLAFLAGGLMIRIFIIFHDCGHGSFFKSRLANDICGFITGVLSLTPYYHWRWEHAIHHATTGDLDRRGVGDIWTLTVNEYLASSKWKKFSYRLARNPFVLFVVAPLFLFVIRQRFPSAQANPRERWSVWWMNLAILGMAALMSAIFGIGPYLIVQLTATAVAGAAGVWLFYVQHQFEDVYWERGDDWDYTEAALKGSSFYQLPKVLQWFSGNIGFHHIHHLSPRIPNYNLERCHRSDPMFQEVKPLTLFSSLKSATFRLFDESSKKLVGYRHLKDLRKTKEDREKSRIGDSSKDSESPPDGLRS